MTEVWLFCANKHQWRAIGDFLDFFTFKPIYHLDALCPECREHYQNFQTIGELKVEDSLDSLIVKNILVFSLDWAAREGIFEANRLSVEGAPLNPNRFTLIDKLSGCRFEVSITEL